jgi:hypothetical protein
MENKDCFKSVISLLRFVDKYMCGSSAIVSTYLCGDKYSWFETILEIHDNWFFYPQAEVTLPDFGYLCKNFKRLQVNDEKQTFVWFLLII